MPNQNLTAAEVRPYIKYFKWVDSQPVGSVAASGGGH